MGLVVRMGEGKSRWWWKSLNRRTKLAYWRREAREGILNGAWEEEGRGVRNLLASLMAKSWTDSSERVSVGEEGFQREEQYSRCGRTREV